MGRYAFSARWMLWGALYGAGAAGLVVSVPGLWGPVTFLSDGWLAAVCGTGAAAGGIAGAFAGRTITDGIETLLERVTRWLPWWW